MSANTDNRDGDDGQQCPCGDLLGHAEHCASCCGASDQSADDPGPVVAIYRQEEGVGTRAATIIERVAGPKRYARVWDLEPHRVEWGWTLHPSAVQVWPLDDEPDAVAARFEGFHINISDKAWADGYNHAKVEMLSEACRTCEDNGYDCHPHDRLYVVTCPGEMCATCDYRAGECP